MQHPRPGKLSRLKDNTAKRWENRLGDPRKARDAFVLKSRFNRAWDGFNVHELGRTVVNSWLTWLTENDLRMSRFMASTIGLASEGPRVVTIDSEDSLASAELFIEPSALLGVDL